MVMSTYHFPVEEAIQISVRLRVPGFETQIRKVRASIYRSPLQPYVPVVFGLEDSKYR
jgi:hypothetical protein